MHKVGMLKRVCNVSDAPSGAGSLNRDDIPFVYFEIPHGVHDSCVGQ